MVPQKSYLLSTNGVCPQILTRVATYMPHATKDDVVAVANATIEGMSTEHFQAIRAVGSKLGCCCDCWCCT